MNAISITMAKGTVPRTNQGHAFRLTALMVVLSWAACQLLIAGGCYRKVGDPLREMATLDGGIVLVLASLFLLLCLKRRDVQPSREAGLLFFWTFLVALPGATWAVWRMDSKILSVLARHPHSGGTEVVLLYASIVISIIYGVTSLVWLKTTVSAYDHAQSGALSARIMRRLEALIIEPYLKKD